MNKGMSNCGLLFAINNMNRGYFCEIKQVKEKEKIFKKASDTDWQK